MRHTIAKRDGSDVAQSGHSKCRLGSLGDCVEVRARRKTEIDGCTGEQSGEPHGTNRFPISLVSKSFGCEKW